jgi:hypothetical protein
MCNSPLVNHQVKHSPAGRGIHTKNGEMLASGKSLIKATTDDGSAVSRGARNQRKLKHKKSILNKTTAKIAGPFQ